MAVKWRNNGEADDAGTYVAEITFDDGSQAQVFKGKSYREVADKLLNAQDNASRTITRLKAEVKPDPAKPRTNVQPRPLTAGDRLTVATDVTDPNRAPEAIVRVVESVVGPIKNLRETVQRQEEDADAAEAAAAATEFKGSTPDWYPTEHNKQLLWDYMTTRGYAFTARNFGIAWDALKGAKLAQFRQEEVPPSTEEETPPTPRIANGSGNGSTNRPRGTLTTTGIRSGDATGSGPRPARSKYSKEDIAKMSRDTYKDKLEHEPGFSAFVNSL